MMTDINYYDNGEPIPDGKLEITLRYVPSVTNSDLGYYNSDKLTIPFSKIKHYRRNLDSGLVIIYKDYHVVIPWNNILFLTVHCNSDEYVQAINTYRMKILEDSPY